MASQPERRVACFVDGSNLLLSGQAAAQAPIDPTIVLNIVKQRVGVAIMDAHFFNHSPQEWLEQRAQSDYARRNAERQTAINNRLRDGGVHVIDKFGFKEQQVLCDGRPVTGYVQRGVDCAIAAQMVSHALHGATDLVLVSADSDFSPCLDIVSNDLHKTVWLVGFGRLSNKLMQYTGMLSRYIDLNENLREIIYRPGGAPVAQVVQQPHHNQQQLRPVAKPAPVTEPEPEPELEGVVTQVGSDFGFIALSADNRSLFFAVRNVPRGTNLEVGDRVCCRPVSRGLQQGRAIWHAEAIRLLPRPVQPTPIPPSVPSQPVDRRPQGIVQAVEPARGIGTISVGTNGVQREFRLRAAPHGIAPGDKVSFIVQDGTAVDLAIINKAFSLVIQNLPVGTEEWEIFSAFKIFGFVQLAQVVPESGIGLVHYATPAGRARALQAVPPISIRGTALQLCAALSTEAPPPSPRPALAGTVVRIQTADKLAEGSETPPDLLRAEAVYEVLELFGYTVSETVRQQVLNFVLDNPQMETDKVVSHVLDICQLG
eukprot:TRINITY_DN11985_c0_g1_i1.p1 TRINITY_DN11985_c0_g1~~TRINITY_DN11985_c0_g1_i1.p1  ORF type:complete len:541 (+),score=68.58 TRINITY_DN11985_c0_g1_i1:58-1680(+)